MTLKRHQQAIAVAAAVPVLALVAAGCSTHSPAARLPQAQSPISQSSAPACGAGGGVVERQLASYRDRPFLLATPRDGGRGRPLVVALHGSGGTPADLARASRLADRGPSGGVSVVLPTAADRIWHNFSLSDQPYLDAVVDEALRRTCADRAAVVLAGFSNGGDESQTIGCAEPRRWRAVVVVSSSTTPAFCRAGGPPVTLLRVHGLQDRVSPFVGRGGSDPRDPVLPATAEWAAYDGCDSTAVRTSLGWRWRGCRDARSVDLLALPSIGHEWPQRPDVTSFVVALAHGATAASVLGRL